MNKFQWRIIVVAGLLTLALFALTQNQIFGLKLNKDFNKEGQRENEQSENSTGALATDTILAHAKEHLSPSQRTRLSLLESSISRGNVADQKIHLYHQLAAFWRDSARLFEPFAWFTAEAARLENSEKSLTFAAHLFLNNLRAEEDPSLKKWKALQSKDLFERSLKLAPSNDSSQVALGATYLYGGLSSPMEGIMKIRAVVEKDSNNLYAQMTLGEASAISGQLEKALQRYQTVARKDPNNVQAMLALADVYERMGNKSGAVAWYKKTLPLIPVPEYRKEVAKRIEELNRK